MKKILLTAASFAFVAFAAAQETKPMEVGGVEVTGYVDAYYQSTLGDVDESVQDRSFYGEQETFALGNANITLAKEVGKVGGVAQLGFGPRAEAANGATSEIQQLYVYYKASDAVTLTAGTFGTFVGYEVIDAPANFHYSTSNLFQNGPFFHTGIKADVDLGNGLSAMVGVFNDTDSQRDTNGDPLHFGAQLGYSAGNSNVYLNGIYGNTTGTDSTNNEDEEFQIDLVADTSVGDAYFALNASYYNFKAEASGSESQEWFGIAGYGQYSLSEPFAIGARVEYMDDSDAVIGSWNDTSGDGGSVVGVTLSAPYSVDGFRFIPEVRLDIADNDVYEGEGTQFTLGGAVMYAF